MGKTGKEGLKAQVTSVDPRKVDTAMARKAKEIVERFDLNHVKGISNGLALFYIFVSEDVNLCLNEFCLYLNKRTILICFCSQRRLY